ncbi:MAG: aspartate aminotransferase family protein [Firmicutes bacterium]|nr:aspartate aminotransferase family protein [Bacillota bacterium]
MNDGNVFYRNVKKGYPVLVKGEGVYLWDRDGNRYLDGCAGALVANIGHGVREIARVMATQAEHLSFAHGERFTAPPVLGLARRIAELAPGSLKKIYFVSGGSEATESALKLARQYFIERDGKTQKYKAIARWHSYHGNTLGALSMSGHVPRRRKYQPLLCNFPHIPAAYCYRCAYDLTYPKCDLRCAAALEEAILAEGPENVAAFIAEPVVGAAAGALTPPPGYFEAVRRICDRYDVLLIADEVMCGVGRTGKYFAIDHWGVVPDIMALAKGLGSGYTPLAAIVVKDEIWETFRKGSGKFVHGHTYGGNPVSCAAGCAVFDYMKERGLVENAASVGIYLKQRMAVLADNPIVGDVRGIGLMIGVELVKDKATKQPFEVSAGAAELATRSCMKHGVIVYPGQGCADGVNGDQFLVGPPLTITRRETDELVEGLKAGLADAARELLGRQGGDRQ